MSGGHNCPNIWKYWLPDEHHGIGSQKFPINFRNFHKTAEQKSYLRKSWVCTTNHHKVKAIFWISVIQMVIASIAFIVSFFGEEQLIR